MTDAFALNLLLIGAVGIVALLANRLGEVTRLPAPLLILLGSAVAVKLIPSVHAPDADVVQRLVTVALLFVLFDGGMHIGWRKFQSAASPILVVGVFGTFFTAAAAAWFVHVALGFAWFSALLVATAVSPTDPAVVFSVLGQREIVGRSGTILEGESGANDPVGIALMVSVIKAGGISLAATGHIGAEFGLQMGVGAAIGVSGGYALQWFMRTVPLPSQALYPLRTSACVLVLYGAAALLHGSGFLAVFVAGILIGDSEAPYKRELERFHSALAGLGEIVAFAVLGLTINLSILGRSDVFWPGLSLAVVLAVLVRPLAVRLCLLRSGLSRNEQAFVLFSGLKGAVPILLGTYIVGSGIPQADRLYGIVVIVVLFSVLVQASLVPAVSRLLRVRMRSVPHTPWAVELRLQRRPDAQWVDVAAGAAAAGCSVSALPGLSSQLLVSALIRNGELLTVPSDRVLLAGDRLLLLAGDAHSAHLETLFAAGASG